ncbi:hypothetical protein SFUMM280S_08828 [Streptomyces fumanus]
MRSWVRLARSAKSSAPAERLASWVSSLLLAADGFTGVASGAAAAASVPSSPVSVLTEAAAMPATPITQAEGTAMVNSADRLAGRRREREAARAPAREAAGGASWGDTVSSWPSRSTSTAGSSPVAVRPWSSCGSGAGSGSRCGSGPGCWAGSSCRAGSVPSAKSVAGAGVPSVFHWVAS